MRFLEINKTGPIFKIEATNHFIQEAHIGRIQDRITRANVVKTFQYIAIYFDHISMALETVDMRYHELHRRRDESGFLFSKGSLGNVFSDELIHDLRFFINHEQPWYEMSIDYIPWFPLLETMVKVYNALLGAYMSRSHKIEQLGKQFEQYTRIPNELEQCRIRIEKFADQLESYFETSDLNINLFAEILNRMKQSQQYSEETVREAAERAHNLLIQHRMLVTPEQRKQRRFLANLKLPDVQKQKAVFSNSPQERIDALPARGTGSNGATTALVLAGIGLVAFAGVLTDRR